MIEAWMLREIQRQGLLEKVMREVYEAEEKGTFKLLWLVEIIIKYFDGMRPENTSFTANVPAQFFFERILPEIKSFARADEEANFLVAELLQKVLKSALMPIHSAKMALEMNNPQLIFNAPSAMTEVEMPEEK